MNTWSSDEMAHDDMPASPPPARKRWWLRRLLRFAGLVVILVGVVVLVWLRGALYNRFVRYPREEAAWQALRAGLQPVTNSTGWTEFRGILHTHSHLSHDSEVPFEEILRVLKTTGLDFICLSDHTDQGRADFGVQWRGLHEGKLFVPGFEMKEGIMPFGAAPGVVLSNQMESTTLARQIIEHGGVLFYAHPEERRDWDRPELTGMEIYNIHTDFKRTKAPLRALVPDLIVNQRRYPEHILRSVFTPPTEFLRRWDELNRTRHLTGIAANDCHQNVGVRGFYTDSDTIRVEDTSPKTLKVIKLNGFTRLLARMCFGPLTANRKLFHLQLDPYERSARFVNTHVLARELTEPALLDSLRAGRAFVGFDMIADSSGFQWVASGGSSQAVMGEASTLTPTTRLTARSPLPCRFTVLKDGTSVFEQEGRDLEYGPASPGKYRVEAELKVLGKWVPWVYANPIELR